MMAGFIEELFYGKIDPQARGCRKDRRSGKVLGHMNEIEEKLHERLQGEDKEMFLDFCNVYAELMCDTELDSFSTGFSLGVRMMMYVFCGDDTQLKNFLKE